MVARVFSITLFTIVFFLLAGCFPDSARAQLSVEDTSQGCMTPNLLNFLLRMPVVVEVEPVSRDDESYKITKVYKGSATEGEVVNILNIASYHVDFSSKEKYVVFMRSMKAGSDEESKKLYTAISCVSVISMKNLYKYSNSQLAALLIFRLLYFANKVVYFLLAGLFLYFFIFRKSRNNQENS
ncbi:MAG: hypothetical protein KJ017_07055 [Alphaproteobacteria bacterium]|nr:hypothetical protein [Alphaproteobacteria bacterium]